MFEPGKTTSGVRWRWVLAVGAGVAALAFALIYLTVTLYAAALSIFARGELERAGLDRFADFMAAWGLPGLYLLLMVGGAAWLARRTAETNVWQGVTVGLVSATLLQAIGPAFGPPSLRELILYPLIGMAGGISEALQAGRFWRGARLSTRRAATSAGTWRTRNR